MKEKKPPRNRGLTATYKILPPQLTLNDRYQRPVVIEDCSLRRQRIQDEGRLYISSIVCMFFVIDNIYQLRLTIYVLTVLRVSRQN